MTIRPEDLHRIRGVEDECRDPADDRRGGNALAAMIAVSAWAVLAGLVIWAVVSPPIN